MAPKRPSEGDVSQAAKMPKIEPDLADSPLTTLPSRAQPSSDFSGSVKKKLANSSRTGQACDRCKVRKIRCDPRPEGCSPCAQNRTPCKTTDRITGRATTRGHTEAMEAENTYLRAHIAELQSQLKDMGVEPRAPPAYTGYAASLPWPSSGVTSEWGEALQRRTSSSPMPSYTPASGLENNRPLPQFKQSSFGDNYLGVSSADSLLSNIKGTSLSVFGHEIDISDFVEDDQFDRSAMSYDHFLTIALNLERVEPEPLPPYQTLSEYCTWYLRSLNPYTMLVHKPTLMDLVWRIGNEPGFTPTTAETVLVHMVLASLKYQIAIRNGEATMMMEESHRHYRYALSHFKDLLRSHTWQDVQALAVICHHIRNFPKPGAAWIMVSTTFLLAVELGFHRSAKAWVDPAGNMDKLEVEMRKRIFWALHMLASNLCGKLGRPMPISMDDIDVEFPEPLSDCLPGEDTNLTPYRKCSFQVGIQVAKYTVWSSKLYGTLYAVNRSSRSYDETLKHLEAGIHQWREELPNELKDPTQASQDDYIFALYLEYWYQEYRLLLHHPAVCRSRDPEVINSNMDKCLSASGKMLRVCNEMKRLKSLDIPWINAVVYIAAVFTTLFIYFHRKDDMSPADITNLRNDMEEWVSLMGECGQLLGSGKRLQSAIHNIVERSLASINESIFKRTASLALQNPQESPASTVYSNGNHGSQYPSAAPTTEPTMAATSSQAYAAAPASAPYSYGNGQQATVSQTGSGGLQQQPYGASQDPAMSASHAAALRAAASSAAPQQADNTYVYPTAQLPSNGHQTTYPPNGVSPQHWQQWTRTFMPQGAPQGEFLNTATTLMALGGREGSSQGPGQESQVAVEGTVMQGLGTSSLQWPNVQFGLQTNGHVGQQ